ncbi:uncharacterized protein B0H64DRAFT_331111 [Chaetomium fimeti]|uniref:Protein kinase domain-containing protein n=1 Tax=Chaetomium fimeti TaxID=1854472 RepID=A0AAE0H7X8_9PEZI|nr:hypothetical protein B0H64DRAFT_331111 [Chaetomium fimeti]
MVEDARKAGLPLALELDDGRLFGVATSFSACQWLLVAQIFNTDTFTYSKLEQERRLPFLNWDPPVYLGTFSTVWERVLHKDHLILGQEQSNMKFDSEHPRLALKELKLATDEVKRVTGTNMSEAQILETMNRIGHQHLLQTIAHYERGGKDYFLFPWAERGSLREYWKTTAPTPTPEYVMWLVAQMAGLADAVSKLHDRGCRHGDLKPDNILCFGGQSDATEDTMVPPDRLVVGDLGLAKIHDFITAMRKNIATDTKAGTMMYSPPEYVQGGTAPWSRLFDIWSLGCIYFEFVVWLLRGQHGQQTLSRSVAPNDSERNTFYTLIGGDGTTERQIAVHGTVKQYIEELLNDPRCTESTGLRRVIRLIADEMIVMERTQESESSRIARPVTIRLQPATTIEPEEKKKVRATAHKVHKILTTILSDMKRGITDAIGNLEPSDDPHPPSNKLNLPSHEPDQLAPKPALGTPADHRARSYLNVPVCHRIPQPSRFNEAWEHSPDTEIAGKIFDYLQTTGTEGGAVIPAPYRRGVSPLCRRCAQLKLSAPSLSFADTLAGLAEKKGRCALCALLYSSCVRPHESLPRKARVQFSRAGSYLTARREREEPQLVASLYRTRFVHNAQDVQLGFPNLPAPGSRLHLELLSLWVEACDQNHSQTCSRSHSHTCSRKPPEFFPTRVIDVGKREGVVRLLYETTDIDPSSRYVALSHRWGPPPPPGPVESNDKPPMIRTTVAERPIPLTQLPRTFRDAVEVTRAIGAQYLWIDSLCIVQDDPHDWHNESQRMERVYASAYCTLAAIRASSPEDGFLAAAAAVAPSLPPGGVEDEIYVCEMVDDFDEHVSRSELQRRGWVLQERALSRRTIHFTDKQTYWECADVYHSEQAAFLGDSNFPKYADARSRGKRIKLIQGLYEQYSAMQLTYAKDRPAAIRGLEARLVQTIGGPGGHGVFRNHMHRYLLWKRRGENGLERITNFPPDEQVPSWSWMAYAGEIKYIDVPGYNVKWDETLSWPDSVSDPVPFRLEAPVRDISKLQAEDITLDDGTQMITQAPKCVVVGTIRVRADMWGGYEKYCYVLIVEPVPESDGGSESGKAWRRLGVGRLRLQNIVFEPKGQPLDWNWIV